ncbi:MAG TPA: glycerol-3-phosphate 1-O-acyltransferase [Haliea salexigens]|uniref:Glycerol-3-phosphate acyltransferase n=1 Tax=Haliea salexigens TaxID=287487 RepID=A0A3C1KR32_9GAMM|nr:glycerol-3-phosphate 1-O-acyltransferase [Haliea salexigens]
MSLEGKLDHCPWPPGAAPVLFLLDTRNRFEEQLLQRWIQQHALAEGDRECNQLTLDLGDDRRGIDTRELRERLSLPDEVTIAPLRVAWTPPLAAINAGPQLRDLVLGDPRRPSARRARRIAEQEPERMHLVCGEPDSLGNLRQRYHHKYAQESSADSTAFGTFVARQAAVVLDIAERRLQGGSYKVPRYVAESLRANRSYNEALEKLAKQEGTTREALLKKASVYMEEMISIPSTFWLDVWASFCSFCLRLGYEREIVCDPQAVEAMRQTVRDHPSMLLWTHKTYLDGMVVPKVLYDNDFPMPHMFGGANIAFAGMGFLIRRSGGIFIKRSFGDNALYKLTLRHYIGYLMEKRFPMNWSFEGTRSRLGKLMPPRYGLLKYALEACHATDARDIHIIPISISYDLIRDVEEYATEQTGRGKGAESLRWFIGYVRSLARPMGKIYMDIGSPVVLPSAPDPDDSLALSKIAFEVAVEANRVTPITFPSLVTMSLLGAAPKALTEAEVVEDLRALLDWAEARSLRISADFDRGYAEQMDGLLGIMINEGIVARYDEGPEDVYAIALEQHPVASYYRNTVIHFFVNKAIIELALVKSTEGTDADALATFWAEVDELRDLFKFEFFYAPSAEFHQEIREELARYHPDWESLPASTPGGFTQLLLGMTPVVAHVTLLTYVEAYSVVSDLAARAGDAPLESQQCVTEALTLGQQLYLQRRISSASSIGKLLFRNGYQMLEHRKLAGGDDAELAPRRQALARQLRALKRRLEVIRALGLTGRDRTKESLQ